MCSVGLPLICTLIIYPIPCTPGLKPKNVGLRGSVNFFSDPYSKSAVESKYDHHLNQKIRLEELFAFFEKVIW